MLELVSQPLFLCEDMERSVEHPGLVREPSETFGALD